MRKSRPPEPAGFGELLYTILIREKRQAPSAVADALGIPLRTFNVRMRGLGRFAPEEIATLLHVVPDRRLAGWFLDGSSLLLVNRPVAVAVGDGATLIEHATACLTETIAAICDLTEAMVGAMLGDWQRSAIETLLDRAQAALLSIKPRLATPAESGDDPPQTFRHLVRDALIEQRGIRLDALAAALGLTYSALYLRMSGRTAFRPGEIRLMLRAYPDARCAACLLAGSPYLAIPRPVASGLAQDAGPIKAGLESLRAIARLLDLLRTGESMSHAALSRPAEDCLDEAVRLLATTRWAMTYIGRTPPRPDPTASPRRPPFTKAA
jgi:hypothetical protein